MNATDEAVSIGIKDQSDDPILVLLPNLYQFQGNLADLTRWVLYSNLQHLLGQEHGSTP